MTDSTKITVNPVGSPGLNVMGGYIYEEWDRRLTGTKAIKTYREMVDDPNVYAVLFAIESMVRAVGFRIDAADDSEPAKAEAELVHTDFDEIDGAWGDTFSEILSCIPFGFSLMEVLYKRLESGRVTWDRWAPRAQETIQEWTFDQTTWEATHAIQQAPPRNKRVSIPLDRCLHFRIRPRKQNPQGSSLLRPCFDPWYFTKHIQRIEAIGIERDLTGIPEIGIPADDYNDETKRTAWEQVGSQIKANEAAYMLLPTDVFANTSVPRYSFRLVTTAGERSIDTDAVLARYQRSIFRAFLGGFLTLGDQGVGSYALGSTQADLFITAAKALLEGIQDTINVNGVRRLAAINGVPDELIPTFRFNEVKQTDVTAFAQTMVALATAGFVDPNDPKIQQHVSDVLGLPMMDDVVDDDTEAPAKPPVKQLPSGEQMTPEQMQATESLAFAEKKQLTADQIKRAVKAWSDAMKGEKNAPPLDVEVVGEEDAP